MTGAAAVVRLETLVDIVDRAEYPSGTRTLYHATPR